MDLGVASILSRNGCRQFSSSSKSMYFCVKFWLTFFRRAPVSKLVAFLPASPIRLFPFKAYSSSTDYPTSSIFGSFKKQTIRNNLNNKNDDVTTTKNSIKFQNIKFYDFYGGNICNIKTLLTEIIMCFLKSIKWAIIKPFIICDFVKCYFENRVIKIK